LDAGRKLEGIWMDRWAPFVYEFFKQGGDVKILDNALAVMQEMDKTAGYAGARLFNSMEHVNTDIELKIIKACHQCWVDFSFHMNHQQPIPGTYPSKNANGVDVPHAMYDLSTPWHTYDNMIAAFAKDERRGVHTCAWFNGRMFYSSTMDYRDPYMALNGHRSLTKTEREERLRAAEAQSEAYRVELVSRVDKSAPKILSPEKYKEWQTFFADWERDIMLSFAQCSALEIIEMINRGDDLDDVRAHFIEMDLDKYDAFVADYVEQFSDFQGDGLSRFLRTGNHGDLSHSRDDGREQ
jgi:hypothetical protein